MKKSFLLLGTVLSLYACSESTTTEVVTEESNNAITESTEEQRSQGKEIFSTRCTKCHEAKVIDNYSRAQWDKILPKMAGKANLSAEEAALVHAYVYWEIEH